MGIGAPALATNQRKESGGAIPPGPPFAPTSADNGLSVDPVTGRIVLGGDLGSPSTLLSNRQIDFDAFLLFMTSTAVPARNYQSFLSPGVISLLESNSGNRLELTVTETDNNIILTGGAVDPFIQLFGLGGFDGKIQVANSDLFEFSQGGKRMLTMSNNPVTDNYTLGDQDGAASGTRLEIQGIAGPGSFARFVNNANDMQLIVNGASAIGAEALYVGGTAVIDGTALLGSAFNLAESGVITGTIATAAGIMYVWNKAGGAIQFLSGGGMAGSLSPTGDLLLPGVITTAPPVAGASNWGLGRNVAAAVAVDPTQYVEISINGVLIKLAVVV